MSGDVQPRKRKDKRKRHDRKSESDASLLRQQSFQDDDESSHGVHITKMGNEDVHLHVHHEHGTGGHWCAKIIFFALMAVLLGLVGLIIMENRGLADLDTPLSESRFSNYFDGWVEEHAVEHDAHDEVEASIKAHEEHDEPFEEMEYEAHSEAEDADDEEADEEDEEEDEEDKEHGGEVHPEPEEEEEDENDEEVEPEMGENITAEDEEEPEDVEDESGNAQVSAENVDENDDAEESYDKDGEDVDNINADSVDDDDDDDDADADVEVDADIDSKDAAEDAADNDEYADDDDDDGDDDDDDDDVEESVEPPKSQSASRNSPTKSNDKFDEDGDDNDEDDFASLDDDDDDDNDNENDAEATLLLQEKLRQDAVIAAKITPETDQAVDKNDDDNDKDETTASSWVASLAVKIGVGVALALVSRLVLLRNNPNTTDEPTLEACMRRRLTIATAEDNINDEDDEVVPLLDDEYSEEEIEIEEEIEVEISDIEDTAGDESAQNLDRNTSSSKYVPETFEQLNAMFKTQQETQGAQPVALKDNNEKNQAATETATTSSKAAVAAVAAEKTVSTDIYVEYEDGGLEDYAHEDNDEITDEEDEIDDDYGYELDEGDVSDVDDAELMSRLEAKYGRLPAKDYETDEDSDDPTWTQINPKETTSDSGAKDQADNDEDDLFEQELRRANAEMIRENFVNALRAFNTLTQKYAHKPAAHLGRARLLERLAEVESSNRRLEEAVDAHKRYLAFGELITNDTEYRASAERCIEHLRFMGYQLQAVAIHKLLIARFGNEAALRNQLSLTYMMTNQLSHMKQTAAGTLERWPQDAVAQLHYGLALKQLDANYMQALPYLQYSVDSLVAGTQEAYFYLMLGDTLQRLGRQSQALAVYKRGAQLKFFPSMYQRALYNVPQLRAQPFWQAAETGYAAQFAKLQHNWQAIRDEALALLSRGGYFEDEAEQLRDTGDWQQYELYARGQLVRNNCQRAPITCALLAELPAATGCRRGQVKFSAMHGGTHVWPHCGPTNCRLRVHLTLAAPEPDLTSLRVAEQQRTWRVGELFIFDDSFEHEVWHNGTQLRLVLILDVWHPDLTMAQRRSLTQI